ncbi:MAG: hypothetical protein E7540_06585 [Ruminococcaceae bacterium]|nr:hypothetical protein [Oscillospiraceae bacterium]
MNEWFNFEDVGEKIKKLTKILFWVTSVTLLIAAIIALFAILYSLSEYGYCDWWYYGIIVIAVAVIGIPLLWAYSWLLYGFGEIITKLSEISQNTLAVKAISARQEKNAIANNNSNNSGNQTQQKAEELPDL